MSARACPRRSVDRAVRDVYIRQLTDVSGCNLHQYLSRNRGVGLSAGSNNT
jgi:hypothetical protein